MLDFLRWRTSPLCKPNILSGYYSRISTLCPWAITQVPYGVFPNPVLRSYLVPWFSHHRSHSRKVLGKKGESQSKLEARPQQKGFHIGIKRHLLPFLELPSYFLLDRFNVSPERRTRLAEFALPPKVPMSDSTATANDLNSCNQALNCQWLSR